MILNFLKNFFNSSHKYLKKVKTIANQVEQESIVVAQLKDNEFPKETKKLKKLFQKEKNLDILLVRAFALAREASKRITGLNPYYVQLLGAVVLNQGQIAEMKTGEGKTLTSIMPAYLNALSGDGVHIVTVNEYLARREAEGLIGDTFRFLGLTVGLNVKDLTLEEKQLSYDCDILYSTNSELGFDYLRDNMEIDTSRLLMRKKYNYAIIDEVDSILIDEARTPLIISSSSQKGQKFYRDADRFVKTLKSEHYIIDLESKTIELTEKGIQKGEIFFRIQNLYSNAHYVLLHSIKNALKACFIMEKNKDYLVEEDRVLIVDQFTGRILKGRQFSDGLHQALEAKENCTIKKETEIAATITYQNFFRIYNKLSGMTGTAKTEEKEFINIYNMKVIEIPTNQKVIRKDMPDYVFSTLEAKWEALLKEIEERYKKKQPVLIGTITVAISEQISRKLKKRKIPHEILNAKNHLKESEIIAKAGQKSSITIATNMAGRGTDIRLGEGVVELGGLVVLGTERHESRRIDNQLRGRSGRQGDPGFSRFFVSGEDELVKRFGGKHVQKLIMLLENIEEKNVPTSSKFFTKFFTNLQKKIENSNFNYRKFILQFDSVLGFQREIIYQQRKDILNSDNVEELALNLIKKNLEQKINFFIQKNMPHKTDKEFINLIDYLESIFFVKQTFTLEEFQKNNKNKEIIDLIINKAEKIVLEQKNKLKNQNETKNYFNYFLKIIMLQNIDSHFKKHITDMNILSKSINFVSYGQQNVLNSYQEEGKKFFNQMINNISLEITRMILKFSSWSDIYIKQNLILNQNNEIHEEPKSKKQKRNYKNIKKPWN